MIDPAEASYQTKITFPGAVGSFLVLKPGILHCVYEQGKELGDSENDLKSKHIEQGDLRSRSKAPPSSSVCLELSPAHSRAFGHSHPG